MPELSAIVASMSTTQAELFAKPMELARHIENARVV